MVAITLTKEQFSVVESAEGPVIVRDVSGREVAVLMRTTEADESPLSITPEEWEAVLIRMRDDSSRAATTSEMLARLKSRAV